MPITRAPLTLTPHKPSNNKLDFGVLYTTRGEATDEIFIAAKKENGEEIVVSFSIEDSEDIINAIKHCAEIATLARHGEFSRPAHVKAPSQDTIDRLLSKIIITKKGQVN